ncbi:DUF397 domain-containing protein [Streptomyces sp. NA04227]|uniref:DUF397 domain-containing protein n=1 Tax=Streptomyces sp. NA04227 TaxID=2742136 RepID=UPI00159073CB|nr:DUF397 domain-containing protein [Streptomyces sp. NA04227]QKW06711.1 DUF397 domain-containing protein [Streptomyces sp. NA04227]
MPTERPDLIACTWRKSSYSNASGGDCVEVADGFTTVPVRDSKQNSGPVMVFGAEGWTSFIGAVKTGRL